MIEAAHAPSIRRMFGFLKTRPKERAASASRSRSALTRQASHGRLCFSSRKGKISAATTVWWSRAATTSKGDQGMSDERHDRVERADEAADVEAHQMDQMDRVERADEAARADQIERHDP